MSSYVYKHRDLDPGPKRPDGTRRPMNERERIICDALAAQGRVLPSGRLSPKPATKPTGEPT